MYDPLVVDTFIASYAQIAPLAIRAGQEARSLIGPDWRTTSGEKQALNQIRANASETALLNDCADRVGRADFDEALTLASQTLRQLTPVTTCAFYRYDAIRTRWYVNLQPDDANDTCQG